MNYKKLMKFGNILLQSCIHPHTLEFYHRLGFVDIPYTTNTSAGLFFKWDGCQLMTISFDKLFDKLTAHFCGVPDEDIIFVMATDGVPCAHNPVKIKSEKEVAAFVEVAEDMFANPTDEVEALNELSEDILTQQSAEIEAVPLQKKTYSQLLNDSGAAPVPVIVLPFLFLFPFSFPFSFPFPFPFPLSFSFPLSLSFSFPFPLSLSFSFPFPLSFSIYL